MIYWRQTRTAAQTQTENPNATQFASARLRPLVCPCPAQCFAHGPFVSPQRPHVHPDQPVPARVFPPNPMFTRDPFVSTQRPRVRPNRLVPCFAWWLAHSTRFWLDAPNPRAWWSGLIILGRFKPMVGFWVDSWVFGLVQCCFKEFPVGSSCSGAVYVLHQIIIVII